MKCMIVEDEQPAVKVLESYIGHFSDLEITGVHHNAMDAFTSLQKSPVDILFLDIQLPKISGIQFLHSLHDHPAVILTTAHREFALDGYELEITDYLLKPISFGRFTKAIAKVYKQHQKPLNIPRETPADNRVLFSEPFIYIKSDREFIKIYLKNILYIESIKNHVKLATLCGNYFTLMSLSQAEEKLPGGHFMRIHRSFIVSLEHISKFTPAGIQIGNKYIPVGRHYKKGFLHWVEKNIV
ncbi:DNA-binding response regulator [Sinomicrobium pectinilyticum]|uniref:DNA-binding response regulator n=1 Tax=Sinomicrobium pectinilyticum TaxID=1084421 RepID=A0A3N0E4Y9_SINP1|nr:LytTR family DNA-binding domain-containing protein [Sinomicrobium pectinilyticum]RNL82912.1 DNA-binding response regulator [Sinomicrobium pectinilyticum]